MKNTVVDQKSPVSESREGSLRTTLLLSNIGFTKPYCEDHFEAQGPIRLIKESLQNEEEKMGNWTKLRQHT